VSGLHRHPVFGGVGEIFDCAEHAAPRHSLHGGRAQISQAPAADFGLVTR
jgi:hypothetical protein